MPMSPQGAINSGKTSAKSQLLKHDALKLPYRKPLYVQMEQKATEFEKDALEEKKKRLVEIRTLHKPLEK